jgi:hypothetical protein
VTRVPVGFALIGAVFGFPARAEPAEPKSPMQLCIEYCQRFPDASPLFGNCVRSCYRTGGTSPGGLRAAARPRQPQR